jgi:hypothetical protein
MCLVERHFMSDQRQAPPAPDKCVHYVIQSRTLYDPGPPGGVFIVQFANESLPQTSVTLNATTTNRFSGWGSSAFKLQA